MAMKVEKISKNFIKPSTPTPDHLRSFNLSLLDQLSPPIFVPLILFHSPPSTTSSSTTLDGDHQGGVSDRLKKSLSETLTRFYPFAGRIKDNFLMDCNDEGIEYFESRVNGNISDFMKQDELHHLLPPYDLHSTLKVIVDNDPHLIIQVNLFGCGGIAICVCFSHKIADATTFTTFINTWASITREATAESILSPTFDSHILYPPREGISSPFSGYIDKLITKQAHDGQAAEKIVTRRFMFDGTKIATLQARYGSKNEKFPTRVEAVIALIWKTIMTSSYSPKPSMVNLPVDVRRRLDPPLPEQSFGSLIMNATASAFITETTREVNLVGLLRESIRKINNDSLKVLQSDEGFLKFQEYLMNMKMEKPENELEVYNFTSWCRFPLYEADFGWGKPNWVTIASQPFLKNSCLLMDNRTGDGVEVKICLVEEHMAIFERDQELLDFASFLE